jgi:hypothetical protein
VVSKATRARANEFYRALGAKLRLHGFRGTGGHWHYKHESATICIGAAVSSRYGLNRPISLKIGLAFEHLYDRYSRPPRPKTPKIDYCHYVRSIGWLNRQFNPDPFMRIKGNDELVVDRDVVLKIQSYTTDDQFAERLHKAETLLVDIGLPIFKPLVNPTTFIAFLREKDEEFERGDQYMSWLAEALQTDEFMTPRGARSY